MSLTLAPAAALVADEREVEVTVLIAKLKRSSVVCASDECRLIEAKVEQAVTKAKRPAAPAPASFIDSLGRRWYRHQDGTNRSYPPAPAIVPQVRSDCPDGNCPLVR